MFDQGLAIAALGQSSHKQLLTADAKQVQSLLNSSPYACSTVFNLQVHAGPGSAAVLHCGTVLPIKVHKNEETGEVLNLVLAWTDEGKKMKVLVPVVYKVLNVCPGLKKGLFNGFYVFIVHSQTLILELDCGSGVPPYFLLDPGQDQQLAQPPVEIHPGAGEVAPQLVFTCHLALNYYGHYYTGTLLQGYQYGNQNVSYANDQAYNYWDHSSVGYPPSYGYEQSYYNYGDPHTNGGFVGVSGSMPQYVSYAQYEHPAQRY